MAEGTENIPLELCSFSTLTDKCVSGSDIRDQSSSKSEGSNSRNVINPSGRVFTVIPVSPEALQLIPGSSLPIPEKEHLLETGILPNDLASVPVNGGSSPPVYCHYHTVSTSLLASGNKTAVPQSLRLGIYPSVNYSSRRSLPPLVTRSQGQRMSPNYVASTPKNLRSTFFWESNCPRSLHQLSVSSMVIDVGSTDGKNVKIAGSVTSPEQLTLSPEELRAALEGFRVTERFKEFEKDSNPDLQNISIRCNLFRRLARSFCNSGDDDCWNDPTTRPTWRCKTEYYLACMAATVGFTNFWRFPVVLHYNGGSIFLIIYLITLLVCTIPFLSLELLVGQYYRRAPSSVFQEMVPFFGGVGIALAFLSFISSSYYMALNSFSWFYILHQPIISTVANCSFASDTCLGRAYSFTGSEFEPTNLAHYTIDSSVKYQMVGVLFASWLMLYFMVWKSIFSLKRVLYVNALLPPFVLAFFWYALSLPGASIGLRTFLSPNWSLMLDFKVWIAAFIQSLLSFGLTVGPVLYIASFNKFENTFVFYTWPFVLYDTTISIFSSLCMYSVLGNASKESGLDLLHYIEGPEMPFMTYSFLLTYMSSSAAWNLVFFVLVLCISVGCQAFTVEGNICYLAGFDSILANYAVGWLGFIEFVSMTWFYGLKRIGCHVREITRKLPSCFFNICWSVVTPFFMLVLLLFSLFAKPDIECSANHNMLLPETLGWVGFALVLAFILAYVVFVIAKFDGSFKKRFRSALKASSECN